MFAIEVHGDALAKPLVITDSSTVDGLSFWVGPGTGYSEFMVSRVLSGERGLSKKHIQALSERFGIDPGLFF